MAPNGILLGAKSIQADGAISFDIDIYILYQIKRKFLIQIQIWFDAT